MLEYDITPEMEQRAQEFAQAKVGSGTAYRRIESTYVVSGDPTQDQLQHWFVGKVGEEVGQKALENLKIPHECPQKWEVVADPHFRDLADAYIFPGTPDQKTVAFRTGWQSFHTRVLVPPDMYNRQPADYYIGIRLDPQQKKAYVYGYCRRAELRWDSSVPVPAYSITYDHLHPLEELGP